MKLFKIGTALQIVYFGCCLVVMICMPLYSKFTNSVFGGVCFKIGEAFTLISTFIPVGFIGCIFGFIACKSAELEGAKKYLSTTVLSTVLTVAAWLFCIVFFVHFSGGM